MLHTISSATRASQSNVPLWGLMKSGGNSQESSNKERKVSAPGISENYYDNDDGAFFANSDMRTQIYSCYSISC